MSQIWKGDATPNPPLCNGIVSHRAQIGSIQVFADHMWKQMRTKYVHDLCIPWGISHMVYLEAYIIAHMHMTNQGCSDHEKRLNTPNGGPCRDKDGARSWNDLSGIFCH